MKRADELKVLVMCYWRFNRGCPIVAMEYPYRDADVLAITQNGMVIETEIKCEIRDLKRDGLKPKHLNMKRDSEEHRGWGWNTRCHYFYFAVPEAIRDKAKEVIAEKFPYAGLLVVKPKDRWENIRYNTPVYATHKAKRFIWKPKLTQEQVMEIVKGMATATCRLGCELIERGY